MSALPWLKFKVDKWLTDEQLNECSPHAHGILINLMCVLHKQKEYGVLVLKQKYEHLLKQVFKQVHEQELKMCSVFAQQLCRNLPFDKNEIEIGLKELFTEGVIQIEGGRLSQKRMLLDNEEYLKKKRAGEARWKKDKPAQASAQASAQVDASAGSLSYISSLNSKREEEESEKKERDETIDRVIKYLNLATGSDYRLKTKSTRTAIGARLKEFTEEDLCRVIDFKVQEWTGTKYEQYLRPATLFRESKFEGYLQQTKNPNIKKIINGEGESRKEAELSQLKQMLD